MAVAPAALGITVITMYFILFCAMFYDYTVIFSPPPAYKACFDISDRRVAIVAVDFLGFNFAMAAWALYKESSWIKSFVVLIIMHLLGCMGTCGYIFLQFFKLSPEEFQNDPIYFVLWKQNKRNAINHTRRSSVVSIRVLFSVIGCLTAGVIAYIFIRDLNTTPPKPYNKCMHAVEIDIYYHIVIFAVWIAFKESNNLIGAISWSIFLLCFRGTGLCIYILWQLSYLSPQQPASLIVFKKSNMLQQGVAVKDP